MNIKDVSIVLTIYLGAIFFLIFISSSAYAFPYKGLDIKIQGTIAEMYDDNITFVHENKQEDFITTLGLGLGAKYSGKRRSLDFTGNINKRFHAKFSDIKSSSENLTLNFKNEFSEYDRIRLTDTFSHSQTPASFEEEFGRVTGRQESFRNNFNINYGRDISEHITMSASYGNSQNFFPDEDRNDSSSNRLGLNLSYLHSIATTLLLSYTYAINNFDNSTQTFSIGLKRYITKRLYFDGRIGVNYSSSGNDNIKAREYINILLIDEIDENNIARLLFNKTDQFTYEGGDVFSNWRIIGQYTRQLLKRLNGSLEIFYGQGEFSSTDITDTLLGANLSLSYAFLEDLEGNISYSYSDFDSTNENRGYIRNTLSLDLTKTF